MNKFSLMQIYLIGTAHISQKSSAEVREMIQLVQPSTVLLELCPTRLKNLREHQESPNFLKAFIFLLAMNIPSGRLASNNQLLARNKPSQPSPLSWLSRHHTFITFQKYFKSLNSIICKWLITLKIGPKDKGARKLKPSPTFLPYF